LKSETDLQTWVGVMLFRILMQQSLGTAAPKAADTPEENTPQ